MAASSSSTPNLTHLLNPYGGGPTSAPPPTPSTQPNLSSSSDASDTLSRLLHRLPPNLSLPTRLSPRASTPTNNTTSPLPTTSSPSLVPASSFQLGYFQLTGHPITRQLAESAESEALSLYALTHDKKLTFFPKDWPLGFDHGDDDEDAETGSFCMDGACSTTVEAESDELELASLRELTRELEKVGLEVVQSVMSSMGLENPLGSKKVETKSLMWVSDGDEEGRVYPYVVGLQYQIRSRKWSLVSDSGSVSVEPQVGSVLVTFGDIAQVWSNGKLKKVRGRPTAISDDHKSNSHDYISLTLLLTLPLESTISPLLTTISSNTNGHEIEASSSPTNDDAKGKTYDDELLNIDEITKDEGNDKDDRIFNSFSLEDYAWRVYHERLPSKDPLVRYRIVD